MQRSKSGDWPRLSFLIATAIALVVILPFGSHRKQATQLQWNLVWSDEFNGSGALNSSDWIYDTGTAYVGSGCPSNWGTGEVEVMSSSTDNVFQSNGNLNIRALHTGAIPTSGWTSGRIETMRTDFQPPIGGAMAVEASLQQPDVNTTNGLGYWPAFWMLGAPFRGNCPSWPGIGEIDIMEDINGRSSVFATLHCGSYPGGPCNEPNGLGSGEHACAGCQTAFHTYRVELDESLSPEEIRWYLDGANFFTLRSNQVDATTWNNATNHGFFIIFDLAIGGGFPAAFGGGPTAATISGESLVVDYVRVFYSSPAALRIDSITPPAGRTSGGQQIVLNGSFAGLSAVTMGGNAASFIYTNGGGDTSKITVTTPAHAVGAVDIVLTPTSGSTLTKTNAFAYLPTVFTDDTIMVGQTTAKAQHILELRQAVDAMRAVAGLSGAPWTDPALAPGDPIRAVHITDIRTFLDDAATRLGFATSPYTDPGLTTGFVIKRVHIEELRQRIRTIAG